MNRQTKRLLAKREAAAEKERTKAAAVRARPAAAPGSLKMPGEPGEGRIRRIRRFLKEVRIELKKVAWPTRSEVFTYTVVVLVSVTFVTLLVFGLDYVFAKGVLELFR